MKILGGNQVVFYPVKTGSYEVQLADCLEQLEEYMDEFQIYPGSFIRHNLYVKVTDWAAFSKIKAKLEHMAKRRFPLPMLINFIAAAPVHGLVALESTHVQSTLWNCLYKEEAHGACQHMKHGKTEVVLGSVKVNNSTELFKNAEVAFQTIDLLLSKCGMGFQNLVKQWSYLERMLDEDLGLQRYQIFNDLRARFYDDDFVGIGYPASTEIGTSHGGVVMEFFAVKNREKLTRSIESPLQKAPHEYSAEVLSEKGAFNKALPSAPKVERAQYLTLNKQSMVFVSSTAAMVGERVISLGNAKEQADYIVEIFKRMLGEQHLKNSGIDMGKPGKYSLLKAYVKHPSDFEKVEQVIDSAFSKIPVVMIQADLPRNEMLVEMETEMLFPAL